jgi:glucose-6-phosphate 1-dehydrogenase
MNYQNLNKNPVTFIIFGATGDLAKNKILSALLDLHIKGMLGLHYRIVAYSRKDLSDSNYRQFARTAILEKNKIVAEDVLEDFLKKITYLRGDLDSVDDYKKLNQNLMAYDNNLKICTNKIYYLAVPPIMYEKVFNGLDKGDLVLNCKKTGTGSWTRILVEKPFGNDLEQARLLDKKLGSLFDESQIFRIDHYLAKETIQNIISFRFANAIFEPLWNNKYIDRVEIKLFEKNTVENRINFYDKVGALRDVGQNHILQMLALIAMEDPGSLVSNKIREAREKVLGQIVPYSRKIENYAYRAQYKGYREIDSLFKNSDTETYFRIKLNIKNNRWDRVPFIVESGKALSENRVEINIIFKDQKSSVCQIDEVCHYHNQIKINIQPEEKISICFWTKKPGLNFELEQKNLSFNFSEDGLPVTDAYEKVLYDCINGDSTLFTSTEEVLREWGIIEKICAEWKNIPLKEYEIGMNPDDLKILEEKI